MSGEGGGLIAGHMLEAPLQFRLQPGGRKSGQGCFLQCPKCDEPAFIRRSERMTETTTQLVAHCCNSGCGHIFRADIVFVHTLVAGNIDRPDLALPVCPRDKVPHIVVPLSERDPDAPTFFDLTAEPPPDADAA